MQTLLQDIRYALRQLRHAAAFTLTALLTLAIGIGATTAIFTLTQAIMLKSLPVADPAQLYRIGDTGECCVEGWEDDDWSLFSYQLYQRINRGKKYGHARDVLGLANAAQRRTRDYLLLRLRSHDARRVRTLRFGSTGIESVNADFSGAELF